MPMQLGLFALNEVFFFGSLFTGLHIIQEKNINRVLQLLFVWSFDLLFL